MVNFQRLRKKIRKSLEEEVKDFLKKCCRKSAITVHKLLEYHIVEGIILCGEGPQHHFFNYDPNSKCYVDLSADQFFGISQKILITS